MESLDLSGLFGDTRSTTGDGGGVELNKLVVQSLEKEKNAKGQSEIFKEYQDNIKKSERLRAEILKGVAAGVDTETLFLKAAEVISAMTGDKAFYRQVNERMEAKKPD